MSEITKLYIVPPKNGGEGIYTLIADNGEGLASHFCSSRGFAMGDLESGRPERQKEWKKRFGKYLVLYLGEDSMTDEKLLKRNKAWATKTKKTQLTEINKQ